MLNEGFAADSTLEALLSLPPTDPLAPVQKSFADANRQGWRWAHVPRVQQERLLVSWQAQSLVPG